MKTEPKYFYLKYKESRSGGESESSEPYSCRSPEYIEVTFQSLSREKGDDFFPYTVEVDEDTYGHDTVFLVVVRYQDGDSFGSSHGNWMVWRTVSSEEEALKIQASIKDGSLDKDKTTYRPWTGYFNNLEDVEIHGFRVGSHSSIRYHY